MDESTGFIEEYRQEAEELLSDIEAAILDIEENPDDTEAINRLFRAMHTIKGSGAMFGFDDIADFTHHVETALDKVREGFVPVTKSLIDLILLSRDRITALLVAADGGPPVDPEQGEEIITSLKALTGSVEGEEGEPPASGDDAIYEAAEENSMTLYRIRLRPDAAIFTSGMDPVLLLNDLKELGDCEIIALTEDIPELAQLDPESCYLYWDITLTTSKGINSIKDVFIFVEDDCQIIIDVLDEEVGIDAEKPLQRMGEILVDRGDTTMESIEKAINSQKKIGQILVESGIVSEEKIQSALNEQKSLEKIKNTATATSVRVPSERLDKLINLVGELVITQARLTQVASMREDMELAEPVEEVERLTGELRDSVLNIRMMPIGTTFNKFRRLVRDLSSQLNKQIDLITQGAETEMDKTVLERLDDPLVHLIRNSIDHGIESPELRTEAGKPKKGTILLSARHKGTNVEITIKDDGAGLNPETIRRKAVEKGLIAENADLSEKEIFAQIFAPGFSTSKEVTSVSGRGVGMDVVKKTIESLRGVIDIESKPGKGSTITLKLPLTLAIINGLLVRIEDEFFVLPLMTVEECVEIGLEEAEKNRGRNILNVRGEIVPYIRLREHFKIPGNRPKVEHIVIADVNASRIGFVVDHVIGDHQTVIKPLGPALKKSRDISGATILGDGTVALILDTAALLEPR